jgi:CheY-like chemotaxis protein
MLAIIVGNLDILLRRLSPDEPRLRASAENALSGANRAASLTQRLLAFSRLQPLDPKQTDVNKCVSDMSEMLRRTLGETVVVETVLAGGLWRAFVDCPQLESALLNLSVNARDAMSRGGRLTLETSNASLDQAYADSHLEVTPGQYVLVAVTDTGAGMTPEVMGKAFDPFFTTKGVGEGTGLGLSQVHGFVKQSKGHIKLYSEVGVGTTVKLYLPRDLSRRVVEAKGETLSAAAIEQRFTVLVVEDDAGVRQVAVGALRELGFKVVEADSGAVALERLGEHPLISVMLTDVVMPAMDGRRLVEAALRQRPDLRVLYMTGYTRNAIVHNGMLDAGTRLLTKPFTVDELERELRAMLSDLI